jgi:branched-chain amino acid transport system ATP-binding protein
MILAITDLFVSYGTLAVLKGVSIEIPEGEISVLLGANGSGKSTLLKTVSGFNRAVSGNIWFEDRRIDELTPMEILRAGVSHVIEGKGLFPQMTVMENMEMGAYSRKNKEKIAGDIEAMYERFPILGKKRKEICGNMSGGEQQMLAIARALMPNPKLLLMDEPSQGLSPIVVNEVADIITDINQKGVTIVLVEHNLRLGLSLAHNVNVLENGKIAFEAKATDLSGIEYAKKIYLGG